MIKNLQTIAAVAIIAFFGGFITARHPLVQEAIGRSAHLPEQPDNSNNPDQYIAPQSIKPIEPVVSMPSANAATDPVPAFSANAGHDEFSLPLTKLVPVPRNILADAGANSLDQYPAVTRLPPVCGTAPMPAGRYAVEYPPSAITIYPSTGR
jgi:hypothetical protein